MFLLSCCWLSATQLSVLCRKLDEIWEEAKGEVVIFRWITYLMEETMSILHIKSPYQLPINEYYNNNNNKNNNSEKKNNNNNRDKEDIDARARSSADPLALGYIMDFDKQARREQFDNSEHTCGICYMDYPGSNFIHQLTCDHSFCKDCMKQMCQIHIQAGSISEIKCPDKKCRQQVLPQVVQQLVTEEMNGRYERLLLDRSLNTMDDIMWCPHCSTAVIIDDKENLGSCTNCRFSFCTSCMQTWHPSSMCTSSNKMVEAMKQRVNSAKKEQIGKMKEELESVTWMFDHTKMCPKCRTPIEKTEGCNKMTCFKCGSYFCWECRNIITGYEHFQQGRCTLFPNTPLYNPEGEVANVHVVANHQYLRNMQVRQYNQQLQVFRQRILQENNPNKVKKCPRCKNNVAKENNNNHIACWNCNTQFCYLCSEMIIGTAHFNKGKCKHHTDE